MGRSYWKCALGMLALHGCFAVASWFTLPSRIPVHFNAAGVADGWAGKSPVLWFGMFLASVFIYLLIYALSRPEAAGGWNIPEKPRFEKLTPEQQRPVIKLMSQFGAGTAGAVILVFLSLQVGMYMTAIGRSEGVLPWYVTAVLVAVPVAILCALVPWSRAVKRAIATADLHG